MILDQERPWLVLIRTQDGWRYGHDDYTSLVKAEAEGYKALMDQRAMEFALVTTDGELGRRRS